MRCKSIILWSLVSPWSRPAAERQMQIPRPAGLVMTALAGWVRRPAAGLAMTALVGSVRRPAGLGMTALVGLVQGMLLVSLPVSRPRPPVYLETGVSLFYRTSKASNGGSGQMLIRLVSGLRPGRAWRLTLRGSGHTGRASGLPPSGTSAPTGRDDARRER